MDSFTLDLNFSDLQILKDISKEKKFANVRELINKKVAAFPSTYKTHKCECRKKQKKFKNIYTIPENQIEFYEALACYHSTTVSTVIFRFIIMPLLLEKLIDHTKDC